MENYEFKMTNYPEGMPSPQGPLCGGTNGWPFTLNYLTI
jgi:hypothetical protein